MSGASAPIAQTPFDALGGAEGIRRIVERFYDLMDEEHCYAELRALHADDLTPMRASLSGFLTGWAGGPPDWFVANPGKCMMSLHTPIPIDSRVAGQWTGAMARSIEYCGVDAEVAARLNAAFANIAGAMIRPAA